MTTPEHSRSNQEKPDFPTKLASELKDIQQNNSESPIDVEALDRSEIKFVHSIHEKEYYKEIIAALKDSDVIAIENVGGSPAERAVSAVNLNVAMDPRAMVTLKKSIEEYGLPDQLAYELLNSGKKIIFVDISEDDPEYDIEREIKTEEKKELDVMFGKSVQAVKDYILNFIQLEARGDAVREDKVREQLLDEIRLHTEPIKIAVMQGSSHTRTFHKMKYDDKDIVNTSRVVVPKVGRSHTYDPMNEAFRSLKHFPDREIKPELLNRAVLQRYMGLFVGVGSDLTHPEANELIRSKSEEEVANILERIDKVLHSRLRIRSSSKVEPIRKIILSEFGNHS